MAANTLTVTEAARRRLQETRSRYDSIRAFSEALCQPLEIEDYVIQSMPDVSPTRWHLAHTTWFFETFVLKPNVGNYRSPNDNFEYLFNSYYHTVGKQFPRPQRGHLSRPTVAEVFRYRRDVDEQMHDLLDSLSVNGDEPLLDLIELGLNHEQQHQELMLTDIKHVLAQHPLFPTYLGDEGHRTVDEARVALRANERWISGRSEIVDIGDDTDRFAFDNERPRHQALLVPHRISTCLVTCGDFQEFMNDGGYERPQLWLSLGWQAVAERGWKAPLYWHYVDGEWQQFTLRGLRPIDAAEPVCHISYFEADAFARWACSRLPTESEWESLAQSLTIEGNFADERVFHPRPASAGNGPQQFFGDLWDWTSSPYVPYPGYQPAAGAIGEYNGKFMCNQYVLRGGSCATSRSHIRATYRNFFPPDARWQFTGIRLAKDGE